MSAFGRGRRFSPSVRRVGGEQGAVRLPFWILTAFLVLVLMTGGSSFGNVPQLIVLRPVAVLLAAYGIITLRREHWRDYRATFLMTIAIVGLTIVHLIPLPPPLWHVLPGRGLLRAIDATAGIEGQWRPLTLTPSRTVNALFALTIPVATLTIAVQLTAADRIRMLYVLLALGSVSAFIGLLQAAGLPISLYHVIGSPDAVEAAGLFANQNHQAALLAILIPALAVLPRIGGHGDRAKRIAKPLTAIGALAIVILLIVTGSRAGLILGMIALLATFFYGLLQSDWLDRMPRRMALGVKFVAVATVACAAVAITLWTARGLALQRLELVGADLRPRLWASIVPILPDYQPWGTGIGSYVEVYRWREPLALLRATYSNHAHNEYLEIALTAGVPGLILLAAAFVLTVMGLWRNRTGSDPAAILARLGGTIIVILACASITDYPLRTPLLSAVMVLAVVWCVKPDRGRIRSAQSSA